MKRHTTREGWWEFVPTLSDGIEFKTSGALSGERQSGPHLYFKSPGQLSGEHLVSLTDAVYVVYSYDTPIAWRLPENNGGRQVWVMPAEKYSVTTSRHQSKIRVALESFAEVREA